MGVLHVLGTEVLFLVRSRKKEKLMAAACFSVTTGEIEDAPAPNHLNTFEVYEKEGAVYIKGEEGAIKAGQRDPKLKCSVIVGIQI